MLENSYYLVYTLESRIVVPVRLLIFKDFSHQYALIPASTFINFAMISILGENLKNEEKMDLQI